MFLSAPRPTSRHSVARPQNVQGDRCEKANEGIPSSADLRRGANFQWVAGRPEPASLFCQCRRSARAQPCETPSFWLRCVAAPPSDLGHILGSNSPAFFLGKCPSASPASPGHAKHPLPQGAALNHSCAPNCLLTYELEKGKVPVQVVRAMQDIRAGEELTQSYVDLALPTWERKAAV